MSEHVEADVAFHDAIYSATGNSKLVQMLSNLREQMYRYRMEYLKDRQSHEKLVKEHEEILSALEKRDESAAVRITRQHVEQQKEHITKLLAGDRQ